MAATASHEATRNRARYADDDARWDAVKCRDACADGVFYYSVASTGVYCRPSCPSRRALRKNVAVHDCPADAQRAGFRPCKRCRPDEASLAERHVAVVARACRAIEATDESLGLNALADAAEMSRYHFHRVFKTITGMTPKAYADAHRAERMRASLAGSASVTEAIYNAGFNSDGRFYSTSNAQLGMTPTQYRAGGDGAAIRFAVGDCSLGVILVAATEKGVCAIEFGEAPDALLRDFQARFDQAELIGGDPDFEQLVARVVGLIEAPGNNIELPLDIRGTVFQQQVWQALRDVPVGETVSYAAIAARIGRPAAVRAVAGACAANPLAVAIPCHRVVRTDGGLSGYRWGVERKRALLEREQQ